MFGLRTPELLVILLVFLLLFGGKRLPEMGESLGKGIRAFKKAMDHGLAEDERTQQGATTPGQLPQAHGATSAQQTSSDKTHGRGDPSA